MEVLYRVLAKMYENSGILVEDITDQVMVKEQERKAILASTSAMRSAMSVIKGDPDKKAMFDAALEAVADDVSKKWEKSKDLWKSLRDLCNLLIYRTVFLKKKDLKCWKNGKPNPLLCFWG